jgi:Cd2+/Zn2+-exporting ATPase
LLKIEFDRKVTREDRIRAALRKIGVPLNDAPVAVVEGDSLGTKRKTLAEAHEHDHGGWLGEQTDLLFAGICGILLVTGWLVSTFTSQSPWVPPSLYLDGYVFGGYFTFREALENVLARRFEIDFLMLAAELGAASLREWAEGALLLFLFSLGHALETIKSSRAQRWSPFAERRFRCRKLQNTFNESIRTVRRQSDAITEDSGNPDLLARVAAIQHHKGCAF